jgi:hypothetical protein
MPLSTYSVLAYVLFLIGHINLVVRLQQSVESLSNKSIESTIDCIDAPYAKALAVARCGYDLVRLLHFNRFRTHRVIRFRRAPSNEQVGPYRTKRAL